MLVVDRVELDVLDQIDHRRVLDGQHTVVGQQVGEPTDEVVEVGHMRHHVVGDDHVSRAVVAADRRSSPTPEEVDDRRHPDLVRHPRRPRRRVDAQHADACSGCVPEQVAVVARHLNEQRARSERTGRDELLDVELGVATERLGERGEVRVGVVEQRFGRQCIAELHQSAPCADDDAERMNRLHAIGLARIDQCVGDRRGAERDDLVEVR